jgi:hypothetical protein
MLVRDAPVAIDLAQAQSQSEQKAVPIYRTAGRVRSAPHDGDREGDVRAYCEPRTTGDGQIRQCL